MIVEEVSYYTNSSNYSSQDFTFNEKYKYADIQIKAMTLSKRMIEVNQPRKYAIQGLTGNEYGIIICEQPIDPSSSNNRLIIEIPILQKLSALRGCMRIGIASKQKTQQTNYLLKKFKDHGCFMFSQDGVVLHDQDEAQNMKRISDFSVAEGDVFHLVYDGETKCFYLENHSANTIHTLTNVNLEVQKTSFNQEQQTHQSDNANMQSEDINKQQEQNGHKQEQAGNCSFISSLSNQQINFRSNCLDSVKSQRQEQYRFDYISEEEDELDEQQNTYHFAIMMGIGPSKIQILKQ